MSGMERQIRATQHRLWANAWFDLTCRSLTGAAGAFAAAVVFDRLYGLDWPLGWIALVLLGLAVAAGTVWTALTRASGEVAAAALDEAAGLRERVSTGLYCQTGPESLQGDPFARAVVDDAERVSGLVTVRLHVPLRAPFTAVYSGMAVVFAALLLLLPAGILASDDTTQAGRESEELKRTKVEVKQRLDRVKKIAETNPALKDLQEKLEELDRSPMAKMERPEQVRHDAIKKIDKLGDVLRERRKSDRLEQVTEMKKMLRSIKAPGETKTPAQKLAKFLAEGDFKSAQESIKAMQEKLATLESPQDAAKLEAMKQQLEELAKQLSAAADDKQLEQKLEQAGVKKEDIERMLQQLTKKDLEQLQKQLQQQGMSQKDIQKLAQQLQKRQQACSMCQQMAQALSQAADAAAAGQGGAAMDQLQNAGDQLSELEALEQEMNQLDSMMSELQSAANDVDGCGQCGGQGQGGELGPKPGKGRGGLAPEEETAVRFETHRQKVHTGQGRIIGEYLVDGQQVKGNVSDELVEVVAAEERDATDLIHRDRIPRQYHKAVKDYFSSVQQQIGGGREVEGPAEDTSTDDQSEADVGDE